VNAQSAYPASTIANDGIDRVSKEILTPETDAPATPSASAAAVVN
jgi:hypothetical protein